MQSFPFVLHYASYQQLLKDFCCHLERLGYSKGAQGMLPQCVLEFLYRLEQSHHYELKAVRSGDILSHYEYLQHRPNFRRCGGLSEMMVHHHMYSLRVFFDWLQELGIIESHPMSVLHFAQPTSKSYEVLTGEEISKLYQCCETFKERALLHLFYGCGLRRTEGFRLNVGDVQFRDRLLYVRAGKGGQSRIVPLTERINEELKAYCYQERQSKPQELGFIISSRGTRMSGTHCNYIVKQLQRRSGIDKEISLHSLRHSIATHLLEGGLSFEYVRDFLGHRHLESTQRYTHIKNVSLWI